MVGLTRRARRVDNNEVSLAVPAGCRCFVNIRADCNVRHPHISNSIARVLFCVRARGYVCMWVGRGVSMYNYVCIITLAASSCCFSNRLQRHLVLDTQTHKLLTQAFIICS
jgi:hypothetical protein